MVIYPGASNNFDKTICPVGCHDFENTICPAGRKSTKNLEVVYKTVPANETVYRRTFNGKQRRQIKLPAAGHIAISILPDQKNRIMR